jgi:small-conductance mechanosensitive channel
VPNATIYKSTIVNLSANPRIRCDFVVGIGYDDSVSRAQKVGRELMRSHPAVLDDPEPMVLAESLGSSTVNLHFYFWIDVQRFSKLKVRSAIIRRTKRAFIEAGISMPDESREIVFPQGVPVQITPASGNETVTAPPVKKPHSTPEENAADGETETEAEAGLESEVAEIEEQARSSPLPEEGASLLGPGR